MKKPSHKMLLLLMASLTIGKAFAHETMKQGVINWASTVGPIEGRRTSYTAAVFLPKVKTWAAFKTKLKFSFLLHNIANN